MLTNKDGAEIWRRGKRKLAPGLPSWGRLQGGTRLPRHGEKKYNFANTNTKIKHKRSE